MTPTDSKPACSAWAAKDPICAMSAPGTAAGSPIPILMVPIIANSRPPVLNETDASLARDEADPTIVPQIATPGVAPDGRPTEAAEVTHPRLPTRRGRQILKHAIMTLR